MILVIFHRVRYFNKHLDRWAGGFRGDSCQLTLEYFLGWQLRCERENNGPGRCYFKGQAIGGGSRTSLWLFLIMNQARLPAGSSALSTIAPSETRDVSD
jgi:hypothetical protein